MSYNDGLTYGERAVADADVNTRAAFITKTYTHLAGAMCGFIAIELFLDAVDHLVELLLGETLDETIVVVDRGAIHRRSSEEKQVQKRDAQNRDRDLIEGTRDLVHTNYTSIRADRPVVAWEREGELHDRVHGDGLGHDETQTTLTDV